MREGLRLDTRSVSVSLVESGSSDLWMESSLCPLCRRPGSSRAGGEPQHGIVHTVVADPASGCPICLALPEGSRNAENIRRSRRGDDDESRNCLDGRSIGRMHSHERQFDFDFIVIGSGFGGSVSAHRLVEKGYKVARYRDGSALDTRLSAAQQLVDPSLVLAPQTRPAWLLQHALFPARDHIPWLCCGRRIDYLRLHSANPAAKSLGDRLVAGPGQLESRNAPVLRNSLSYAGRHRQQDPWPR